MVSLCFRVFGIFRGWKFTEHFVRQSLTYLRRNIDPRLA